jgi:hypothetical protein
MPNQSVLVIRRAQMDALRDARGTESVVKLEQCLRQSFPRDVARLSGGDLRAVVRLGMERSRSHGGDTDRDMYLYLTMMFMLGCQCVKDFQLDWAQDLLARNAPIAELHARSLGYLNVVAGKENEHLIKALARIRKLELRSLPDANAPDFETQVLSLLGSLYPTKFEAQSEKANRELVDLGKLMAGRYSMPGAGAALLSGLAFLLGAGFDRDLVHPWIRTDLERPGGESKVEELYRHSLEFADMALR